MKLPIVDKRNYKKVLRELEIAKFPTLPDFLKDYRTKLLKKQPTDFREDSMAWAKLKKYLDDTEKEINKYVLSKIDWDTITERPPREFQKSGIKFLIINNRCILADDMGLGKSLQAILASKFLPEEYNILIITLKTLKYNFAQEVSYYDSRVKVIEKKWEPDKYTVIHFDALKKFKKELTESKFEVIIIDEAHKFRNAKTKRMEIFKDVLDDTKHDIKKIWLLTGTPIDNRPFDYFNLLKLIKHPLSKNWRFFVETFCNGYVDQWNRWQTNGSSNLELLHQETKGIILRRMKSDVAKDLPTKERKPVWLHLNNTKGYHQVIDDYIKKKTELLEEEDINFFNYTPDVKELTKLVLWRQFCALEKIKDGSLLEILENELDKDKKIIVFTNFTKVVDAVHDSFKDSSLILDGRIKDPRERLQIVDTFNRDPNQRILSTNWAVGSVGLNAQGASSVVANDMSWVPSVMLQGEDRAWRIGQTKDVLAQYLIYKHTVEEVLYETVSKKMLVVSEILSGKPENYFDEYVKEEKLDKKSILQELFAKIDRI